MMFLCEDNTAYADTFFTREGNDIINNFTGNAVGVCVREIVSTNYLGTGYKPSLFARIKKWFTTQKTEWKIVERRIPEQADGSLATTMRMLED